jgi:AraC-like DNA-binding protein
MTVSLRYFAPAEPLRGLISSYYLFESQAPRVDDLLRAELAQVRFTLRGRIVSRFADGHVVDCPRAQINGPTSGPVVFEGHGPLTVLGVGLMPVGWAALIGCGADELADDATPLDSVVGAAANATLERLLNARCAEGMAAALDRLFLDLAARARTAPRWFTRAADDWLMASRAPQVDDLIDATGVSARQVERLAKRVYGASPKLLARKYRALQAAVRMGTGEARTWMDAAGDAFYDQPHFIREFKQFVGMTPHRFAVESAPVMRLTIEGRRQLPTLPKLALYS